MKKLSLILVLVCVCLLSINNNEILANQSIDQTFNVSSIPSVPFDITWNDGTSHSFTVTDYILMDYPAGAYYPCVGHYYQIRAYNNATSFTHVNDYGGYINTVDTGGELILDIQVPNACNANFSMSGNYNIGTWNYAIQIYGGHYVLYSTKDILNTDSSVWHASDLPQLTVILNPPAGGTVTISPGILSCTNGICTGNFSGIVTLSQTASSGWVFNYWDDGTSCYEDNQLPVTMDATKEIKAIFKLLSFPLAGYTPYNAPVSSVFDHSATGEYTSDTDHHVEAFNGETSTNQNPYNGTTCYLKSDNSAFGAGFNYVGYGQAGVYYLCYDGHPGYDYPATYGTEIYAAADGTAHLPSSFPGVSDAQGYATVEIDHQNGYKTYYLHLSSQNVTENQPVYRGQTIIGSVGHTVPQGAQAVGNHLHFEVQKDDVPIDPYGWTGSGTDPYETRATNYNLWR